MRSIFICALLLASAAPAAPPREPAPTIEPTGPLRVARYTKPFAQAQPIQVNRDYYARYTYGTPLYYYGCPWGWGGYGWYGCGGYGYRPIYYSNGPYYPSY